MHPEAFSFCASLAEKTNRPIHDSDGNFLYIQGPERGLDIGGANIDGTARTLWPRTNWTVLDKEEGDDVDIVADATRWQPSPPFHKYDIVLCTAVLEHEEHWYSILYTCVRALTTGGHFILTCAGVNAALDERLFDYTKYNKDGNPISPNELLSYLLGEAGDGLLIRTFTFNPDIGDIYFYGRKVW